MIKVRFNLGKGPRYMKWKIEYTHGEPEYLDPKEVQLIMIGCILRNQKATAEKIHQGANKTVCAWVECCDVIITTQTGIDVESNRIMYNPRKTPNWTNNAEENLDNQYYSKIISLDKILFAT